MNKKIAVYEAEGEVSFRLQLIIDTLKQQGYTVELIYLDKNQAQGNNIDTFWFDDFI